MPLKAAWTGGGGNNQQKKQVNVTGVGARPRRHRSSSLQKWRSGHLPISEKPTVKSIKNF